MGFYVRRGKGALEPYIRAHYEAYFGRDERPNAAATARAAGLDVAAFESCVASPETIQEAEHSLSWAKELGATDTPTFFVYVPEENRWQRLRGTKRAAYWEAWLETDE